MTLDLQELRILNSIRTYKLGSAIADTWVNAQELAAVTGLPSAELARALRDLALRDYLKPSRKPRMYGSTDELEELRYGLTSEGARLAGHYSRPEGRHDFFKRQVLTWAKARQLDHGGQSFTIRQLRPSFNDDVQSLGRALRDLQVEGYVARPGFDEADPEDNHFALTVSTRWSEAMHFSASLSDVCVV